MHRALIIENDVSTRILIQSYLVELGFEEIETAYGAQQARAHLGLADLDGAEFDIVIYDWDASELDGVEFLKDVRSRICETPFVVISEHTVPIGLLTECVAVSFVTKPCSPESLRAALKELNLQLEL